MADYNSVYSGAEIDTAIGGIGTKQNQINAIGVLKGAGGGSIVSTANAADIGADTAGHITIGGTDYFIKIGTAAQAQPGHITIVLY